MRLSRVYIAAAYSNGDKCGEEVLQANTLKAMLAWDEIRSLGYAPFCPHWSYFQDKMSPRGYEDWLEYDREWIRICDAIYRLPGESSGADSEVHLAESLGLPVFYTLDELKRELPVQKKGQ